MKDNINLYGLNNVKACGLDKYKDLKRKRDLKKGGDTLSFSYPKSDWKSSYIKEECYLETREQRYVIKEIDNSNRDWITVIAKVDTDGLKSKVFDHFEMVNSRLGDTLNLALAGTGWTIGHNDVTKRRTIRLSNCTPIEIIEEIRKVYRAEIFFDARNKKINVYEQYGKDKGSFFMEDINLKELSISSDTHDYITRLIPIGKDELTIDEINDGKNYVENYQYSNKIIYGVWEDNRYTVIENLKEDAEVKLEELSKPLKSYKADVVDLNGANLGDTIELVSKTDNVKEKQRVVKITEYPLEPWNSTVEIANKTLSFEDMQNEVLDTVDTVDTVLTSDGMVDDSKIDFNPIRQEFVTIIAEKADIVDLNAAVARIGDLEVTKANITDLDVINARIDNLDVEDLEAINADITFLKVKVANIEHLLAGNITAENIAAGAITAGSGIIADGAIGDAQISSLSADKLDAGAVRTALVDIIGPDGRLKLSGNKLQIFDDDGLGTSYERIFLGVDDENNAALTLRGADGQTILLTQDGLTDAGFTDGYNKLEDNSLDPKKIDIHKVVTRINEGTTTIQASKILVDNKTLDVQFKTIENIVSDHGQTINSHSASISALDESIGLKVDKQEFREYKTTNDNRVTTIDTQLSKNTSSINVLQDEIAFKVTQADIDRSISELSYENRNLLENSEGEFQVHITHFPLDVNKLKPLIGQYVTASFYAADYTDGSHVIDCYLRDMVAGKMIKPCSEPFNVTGEYQRFTFTFIVPDISEVSDLAFSIRGNTYVPGGENNVGSFAVQHIKLEKGNKATDWTPAPEDVESEITAINTQVSQLDINLNSITSRVSSTESNIVKINDDVSSIESRVRSAEQKITDDAIVSTVRRSTAYKGDLNAKVNQSVLNTTNSKVTTLEQRADSFSISINDYNAGKLSGASYTFDSKNAIFKAAGLKIQNNYGEDVLFGDTWGNLSISGTFTSYTNTYESIQILDNAIRFFDWEGTTREIPTGYIESVRDSQHQNQPGLSLWHVEDSFIQIGYQDPENPYSIYSYMDFDVDNTRVTNVGYPIRIWEPAMFYDNARFNSGIVFSGGGGLNKIYNNVNGGLVIKTDRDNAKGELYIYNTYEDIMWYELGKIYRVIFTPNSQFNNNLRVLGEFSVEGSKNALVETENYDKRLLNSLETPEYYFQDRGSGKTGGDGYCYIYIDDIFDETVNTNMQYHVEIQEYGEGTLRPIERNPRYFVVKGTPNLEFSWTITAKRLGYEHNRLETPSVLEHDEEIEVENLIEDEEEEEEQAKKELERIFESEMTFNLSDYMLSGGETA